jgi:hypothetical protein
VRAILVGCALAALVCASSAAGGAEAKRPTLRITDFAPLTVRGENFKAGERVKLLVNAGKPLMRSARAGEQGRFVVRLGARVDPGACSTVVQAIGAAGSRAMVDLSRTGCDVRP